MLKRVLHIFVFSPLLFTGIATGTGLSVDFKMLEKCHNTNQVRKIEVEGLHEETSHFLVIPDLYIQGWDTLKHPNFWRSIMKLSKDSGILSIMSTRQIAGVFSVEEWDGKTDKFRTAYRDSIRKAYNLSAEERILFTRGKRDFYDFEGALPGIGKAIAIFEENNTDPFYAQAILLIESPGKCAKSNVGAYGSFQIMKEVAKNMGLRVDKTVDEREDFEKSAWAAAKLIRTICIPELNKILDDKCIEYTGNELWYKLLVLHVYHAGAGNVKLALNSLNPVRGGMEIITGLWNTSTGGFRNASQNYSQLALASFLELDDIIKSRSSLVYYCPEPWEME